MSKLTIHKIITMLSLGLFFAILENFTISRDWNFWGQLIIYSEGVFACMIWSIIFYKPSELKDKYKDDKQD